MAGRDFNIPYGPDKTGGFDLSKIVPEVIPADPSASDDGSAGAVEAAPSVAEMDIPSVVPSQSADPGQTTAMPVLDRAAVYADVEAELANEQVNAAAAPNQLEPVVSQSHGEQPSAAAVSDDQQASAPIIAPDFGSAASSAETPDSGSLVTDSTEGLEEDVEGEGRSQAIEDVQRSFAALKDSIGQGRELKARERELEDLEQKIADDKEELADRDNILANYQSLVAEQDAIIAQNTQQRDAQKATLAQVVAKTEETSDALDRMREYHDAQLDPYETALGRARGDADRAKNDERSRKSELNAAETEARRAEKGGDTTMAQAKLEMAKSSHDEAVSRSTAAKEALEEAQRNYDEMRAQVEQAEAPLERSLEDLQKQTEELKEDINRLGEVISTATKRRQYCDSVYQYPAETEKLRQTIFDDEASAEQLDLENEELRDLLAQSKAGSTKAKVVIGIIAAVIIFVIFLVWFLLAK